MILGNRSVLPVLTTRHGLLSGKIGGASRGLGRTVWDAVPPVQVSPTRGKTGVAGHGVVTSDCLSDGKRSHHGSTSSFPRRDRPTPSFRATPSGRSCTQSPS